MITKLKGVEGPLPAIVCSLRELSRHGRAKYTMVSKSRTDSEYQAMKNATYEFVWIRDLLSVFHFLSSYLDSIF